MGNSVSITSLDGTEQYASTHDNGFNVENQICLKDGCYIISCGGGSALQHPLILWTVSGTNYDIDGGAPAKRTFGVSEGYLQKCANSATPTTSQAPTVSVGPSHSPTLTEHPTQTYRPTYSLSPSVDLCLSDCWNGNCNAMMREFPGMMCEELFEMGCPCEGCRCPTHPPSYAPTMSHRPTMSRPPSRGPMSKPSMKPSMIRPTSVPASTPAINDFPESNDVDRDLFDDTDDVSSPRFDDADRDLFDDTSYGNSSPGSSDNSSASISTTAIIILSVSCLTLACLTFFAHRILRAGGTRGRKNKDSETIPELAEVYANSQKLELSEKGEPAVRAVQVPAPQGDDEFIEFSYI